MPGRQGKKQRDGLLKGHIKDGRIYRPPLLGYPNLVKSDWVKEDFPDLLWPVILIAKHGDEGIIRFRQVQELMIKVLGREKIDAQGIEFDGRLTSIEAVPEELRSKIVSFFSTNLIVANALPDELIAVLRLYENVPGSWLLVEPFANHELALTETDATTILPDVMVEVVSDDHNNALVKCAPYGWLVLLGKISLPASEIDILKNYPLDPNTRSKADSMIRGSFLALKVSENAAHSERQESISMWAQSFWDQNWTNFSCLPEETWCEIVGDEPQAGEVSKADGYQSKRDLDVSDIAEKALQEIAAMFNDFLTRVLDSNLQVDLYAPSKHEVICGFVSRAARAVAATLRAPHLWSGEHGSSTMRVLAETTIILAWMGKQDQSIYERFQNYGRGKAKLMKYHLEALISALPGEPPPEIVELAEALDEKLGGEWGQALQDVSVEATFAGISLRQMATEAGVEDIYRFRFQPASGVTHGEWSTIEDYAMQRCMNPLHLFHWIPSFEPEFQITPEFGPLLVHLMGEVIDQALHIILAGQSTVNEGLRFPKKSRR